MFYNINILFLYLFVCLFQLASLSQKSVTDLISDTIVMEMM